MSATLPLSAGDVLAAYRRLVVRRMLIDDNQAVLGFRDDVGCCNLSARNAERVFRHLLHGGLSARRWRVLEQCPRFSHDRRHTCDRFFDHTLNRL